MSLPDEVLMTVRDVAERVQMSRETVLDAIRRGDLRARKLSGRGPWRIRVADYEAWLGAPTADPTVIKPDGMVAEANRVMKENNERERRRLGIPTPPKEQTP